MKSWDMKISFSVSWILAPGRSAAASLFRRRSLRAIVVSLPGSGKFIEGLFEYASPITCNIINTAVQNKAAVEIRPQPSMLGSTYNDKSRLYNRTSGAVWANGPLFERYRTNHSPRRQPANAPREGGHLRCFARGRRLTKPARSDAPRRCCCDCCDWGRCSASRPADPA